MARLWRHEQSLFDLDAKYADATSLSDAYMRTVGHNAKA
jgi:hypothetical protein